MYNTVDAALLLIEGVWLYIQRSGDHAFLHEAYPVMERIIAAYRKGPTTASGWMRMGSSPPVRDWTR